MGAAHYGPGQLKEAARLAARNWTHERIAERQGFSRETVTRHLNEYFRERRAALRTDGAAVLGQQIATLEVVAWELYREWTKSRKDDVQVTETRTGDELAEARKADADEAAEDVDELETIEVLENKIKRVLKRHGQCGDPRYLKQLREVLADIRKLLGLGEYTDPAEGSADEKPRIVIPDRDDRLTGGHAGAG